jgi:ABC-type phosphate/phosphonate transport system permease subunit
MSTQEYIRSITETIPDEFPTLTPLPEGSVTSSTSNSSFFSYVYNISWQTWIIIVLILALLGINIFVYLAKGTQETASIFEKIFDPIFNFFGYNTLETTKQTIDTTATGTKAGVDIVAGATTGAINTI